MVPDDDGNNFVIADRISITDTDADVCVYIHLDVLWFTNPESLIEDLHDHGGIGSSERLRQFHESDEANAEPAERRHGGRFSNRTEP